MRWQDIPYAVFLLLAAAALLWLSLYAWRRRSAPGAIALAILTAAGAAWAAAYALELSAESLQTKLFWGEVKYFGIVPVAPAWLAFALAYASWEGWLTRRRNVALLAVEPLLTLGLVFTNEYHHLMWSSAELNESGPFVLVKAAYGPWYWFHLAYSYMVVLAGTLVLLRMLSSARLYRGQKVALLVGVTVPWLGNAIEVLDLSPIAHPDPAPFTFAVTGAAFAWALSRYGLLDLVPVARNAVVEGMKDGVIVLDAQDRVVDLNPAAQRIIERSASEAIGGAVTGLMPDQAALLKRARDAEQTFEEVTMSDEGGLPRHYELVFSSLRDRAGRPSGRLLLLRDVTERKQVAGALKRSEERYRGFIAQSTEGIWRFEAEDPVPTDLPVNEQIDLFYERARLAECNDAMARMYGYERAEDLAGSRLSELLPRSEQNVEYLEAFVRSGYRLTDAESQEVDRAGNAKFFLNNLTGVVEGGFLVRA